jgi:hypothetical protein
MSAIDIRNDTLNLLLASAINRHNSTSTKNKKVRQGNMRTNQRQAT